MIGCDNGPEASARSKDRLAWPASGKSPEALGWRGEARGKVRAGLATAGAECRGSGAALERKRFKHFRCLATSGLMQIPNVTVMDASGAQLPQVVEHEPRTLGPMQAVLDVHVTGR